jgi:deoxyribodipyrimidine photo-lyase
VTTGVVWFRRDLRLVDNPAVADAAAAHDEVVALFVLDPSLMAAAGRHRRDQLLASLHALDGELRGRGAGLLVVEGDPAEVVPAVAGRTGAATVHRSEDTTPYAAGRDAAVDAALTDAGIGSEGTWGGLVQPPGTVLTAKGTLSRVFTPFHKVWRGMPVEDPAGEPAGTFVSGEGGTDLPAPEADPVLPADPDSVRERLEDFAGRIGRYRADRDRIDRDATSGLSVDLRLGTLSPHRVVHRLAEESGSGPFLRQLAWRDWYAHLLAEEPTMPDRALRAGYDRIAWRDDPDELAAWKEGRTGYPLVDAAMRELAATGRMHNRLRMVAASFLVKDLLVDWRHGERHFRRLLLDGDVAQNSGNWQWVAGTGPDAAPYFRVFNPITQSRQFDPDGTYIRRWCPELDGLDGDAVHWPADVAPMELAAAGVELGTTYPDPIVEHAEARKRAIDAYGTARDS